MEGSFFPYFVISYDVGENTVENYPFITIAFSSTVWYDMCVIKYC